MGNGTIDANAMMHLTCLSARVSQMQYRMLPCSLLADTPIMEDWVRFAYLDESGDLDFTGIGASSGATEFFAMALLFVDDPVTVYAAVDAIKDRFRMRRTEEFKFSKTAHDRRCAFLEELRRHDIVICALVVNKAVIAELPGAGNERLAYRDLVRRTIIRHREEFDQTKLVLDEYVRGKRAQQQFNSWLRNCVNTDDLRRLDDIAHEDSANSNMIQAVDMVAGAIRRSRSIGDDRYLRIIQPRIRQIWDWNGVEVSGEPETSWTEIPDPPKRKTRRR